MMSTSCSLAVMYEVVSVVVFVYDVYFITTKSVDHMCGTRFVSSPLNHV